MGGMDVEGGIARKLWNKFRSESVFVNYTPFFVCVAAGNLSTDSFLHYVSQHVHLLNAFVHAYELAEECADDDEDKQAIRKLRKHVQGKLNSNDSLVLEWGFELPEERMPTNTTVKYADFLLATASGRIEGERVPGKLATPFEKTKVAAYTLGAIAPCMRLFAFINKEIQALLDPNDSSHTYKKWIDYYCSQDFEAYAFRIEELLDTLSVTLTGEELDVIEKVYHQSMRLEVEFFSSQPIIQETVVPLSRTLDPAVGGELSIFCDFDLTCAAFDSSAILAEIAIITRPKADSDGSETQLARLSSADLRSTWDALSSQYTEEFEQCIESITTTETVTSFSYEGLCEALEQFAHFEKAANSRVVQSGVLKGLNQEDIKRAGQGLILQDGCKGFIRKIMKNENLSASLHVLSYCWCGDLIRSALSSGDVKALNVYSNELAYEESITTGEIIKKLESPMEKLQAFNNILNNRDQDSQHLTVYIGGSVGDLLCMLKADIGIVMGSNPTLRQLGEQFGVSFVPLFSGLVVKQREVVEVGSSTWKKLSGTLYTVSSWDEIHAFILGTAIQIQYTDCVVTEASSWSDVLAQLSFELLHFPICYNVDTQGIRPVPANGVLRTINPDDLASNPGVLLPCNQYSPTSSKHRSLFEASKREWPWRLMAFQRLGFSAADIPYCTKETNVVRIGATVVVYKAETSEPKTVVAVKKLWRSRTDLKTGSSGDCRRRDSFREAKASKYSSVIRIS
ncbi:hypothetical protein V6N12_063875 [Hibiscus sabdariffa]|uniref:Thiaminase-2/PQQC domain-containing protein n=1 Tax=Hibiscus sabdariffa TaxID=183260 RepID=A0ABR2ASJ1_9ROSI